MNWLLNSKPNRAGQLKLLFVAWIASLYVVVGLMTSARTQNAKDKDTQTVISGSKSCDPSKPNCDPGKLPTAEQLSKPYGSHLTPILVTIGASEVQKTKITQIVESFRPTIEPLRTSYRQKNAEFLQAVIKGAKTEDIIEKQGELFQLHQSMCNQYCKMNLEIRRVLTAEQVPKYEDYRARQGWNKNR